MTTVTLNLSPAAAVAVSKCLVARTGYVPSLAVDAHPRPCVWEDFTRAELVAMLDTFRRDAYHDGRTHPEVEHFRSGTAREQAALVRAAQYPEDAR